MAEPFEVEVSTRHGDVVRADVYLPADGGEHPVLLAASPYQKELRHLPAQWTFPFVETGPIQWYLDRGYAYVWMDVPGSGRSEGDWEPVSRREGEAIHDVIEWIAQQPWSTGKLGMIGQSYLCWSAWNTARTRPPHLTTIVAYDGACDMYRDWMYHGGIPALQFPIVWVNPVLLLHHQALGHDIWGGSRYRFLLDMWSHKLDDEWHRTRSPYWELDQVDILVLSIGVWGKRALHLRGNFLGFERVRGPKQLLITQARWWRRRRAPPRTRPHGPIRTRCGSTARRPTTSTGSPTRSGESSPTPPRRSSATASSAATGCWSCSRRPIRPTST